MTATTEMNVTVKTPDQAAMTSRAQSALALVEAFEIVDDTTYQLGAEELTAIKKRWSELESQRKTIVDPLNKAKEAVQALFKGPQDLLVKAEGIIKSKMLGYSQEQQRKANEERRKAEEAAQQERDRLAAEAKKLHEQGRHGEAVLKETVADMVAPVATQAAPVKAAGISTRKTVAFEVQDLHALVKHIAERPELVGLLTTDDVKLRAYVRGLGMNCSLPGVRVFEESQLAARR